MSLESSQAVTQASETVVTATQGLPTWRAYLALTKPRIIELLLVTTIPTMFLAAEGFPAFSLVCITLFGGALSAGGANALNCYVDRDIDAIMHRTQHRPSATGQISPRNIMVFGLTLSVLSVAVFAVWVNLMSALLTAFAIAFYVLGYTLVLKRRTPQNIVWGGAAGCMPVLIGWSAVTGSVGWSALMLFLIVFFWTPPHYWPLSLRYKEDYARAEVPMLPVQSEPSVVANRIIVYTVAMIAVSFALVPVAEMSRTYIGAAVLLGVAFLGEAIALKVRVQQGATDLKPMRLFHWSITYLALLFFAVGIDPFIR